MVLMEVIVVMVGVGVVVKLLMTEVMAVTGWWLVMAEVAY